MAEKRLIDSNEALRMIKNSCTDNPYITLTEKRMWKNIHAIAMSCVTASPTVDAVEVVRGQWIDRIDNDTPMHECSVCGARVVKSFYEYENPNLYCYHCGARMD